MMVTAAKIVLSIAVDSWVACENGEKRAALTADPSTIAPRAILRQDEGRPDPESGSPLWQLHGLLVKTNLSLLEIKSVGEPVLRQTAQKLSREEILSSTIQQLIENMRETMYKAPGVGLAAPQIGMGLQLAVIEDKAEYMKDIRPEVLAERERGPVPFQVIANPVLTLEASPDADFFEGCLTLPGLTALVLRASRVCVEYLDHNARPRTTHASGWHA